ncbi:MAG: nicotinate (nicotinamide) nucleotide adenylyltransferase [Clostridia bacterium]|nr:nicotinate (nicotinamide) nucleotide adenylyltransferase [Clostridia bacterium]
MKKYKKLAVFGGTFSPVHNGHLRALRAYAEAVRPDVLYVIPTALPPHKMRQDDATDAERLDMLRLALDPLSFPCEIVVSDLEIARGGKSYTIHTVTELQKIAEEIIIYCGTDMLLTLDRWRDYERLLKLVTVAYMQREDDGRYTDAMTAKAKVLSEECGARFIELPPVSVEVSSSEIRERLQRGGDITDLVPSEVSAYILRKGLYKEG